MSALYLITTGTGPFGWGNGGLPHDASKMIWRAQSDRTILPKCALARMCAKAASASANG
jgi:hypothetical protein